jgi:ribosomal protein S2
MLYIYALEEHEEYIKTGMHIGMQVAYANKTVIHYIYYEASQFSP